MADPIDERASTVIGALDEGFCIIEMVFADDGKPIDYRFLETNAAFERHTGLVDAVGRTVKELVPEHDEHWFVIYSEIAVTGEPRRFESPAVAMGRWFDVYAFPIGEEHHVAVVFRDISDRKKVEAERDRLLKEVEYERKRFREVLEQAPLALAILHGPDHVIEWVNEQYRELLGRRDSIGKPVSAAIPEAEEQGFVTLLDQVYESGTPYRAGGVPVRLQRFPEEPAEERFLDFVYYPLREPDGTIMGIVAQAADVTERQRLITEQRQLIRELGAQRERVQMLSAPILRIADRGLLLPLIGFIDQERAELVANVLLQHIVKARARVVVVDITGISEINHLIAAWLHQTVMAVKLLGAKVVVCGASSAVAQTLASRGDGIGQVTFLGDLQRSIEAAESFLE